MKHRLRVPLNLCKAIICSGHWTTPSGSGKLCATVVHDNTKHQTQ